MSLHSTHEPTPEGLGSVSGAPNLPAGFTDTFTSRYIDTGELRLHAVIGGEGPPLLLVHGWPETWYAWRLLMPTLARDFEVDRGRPARHGPVRQTRGGYDTGTQAGDLIALMDALGHERFAVVGHDTGFAISYALAADHPDRVERVALAEIPGSPGTATAPPLFVPGPLNDRLWHLRFNRVDKLNEQLVAGREGIFFGWEFDAGGQEAARRGDRLLRPLLSNPDSLRGSFGWYRASRDDHRTGPAAQDRPADHARPGDRRSRRASANTLRRRCRSSRTTCRAWSFPAPVTSSPRRLPTRCWRR